MTRVIDTQSGKRRTIQLPTVAAMQAARYLVIGDVVETAEYADGNGGGNKYDIVAAGTGTAGLGLYIDLSGSSLQAKGLFYNEEGNVRQFSASGGGVTADSDAFIAMYTELGYIHMTDGTYLIDQELVNELSDGTKITGEGDKCVMVRDGSHTGNIFRARLADQKIDGTNISFAASDQSINDDDGQLGVFAVGQNVYLNGSEKSENAGAYKVDTGTANKLTLTSLYGNAIVDEGLAWITATSYVKGNTVRENGTHDGSSGASVLNDSTQAWTTNSLVGGKIRNVTDGSTATITANTATTITGTLSGGTDNDWDASDVWELYYECLEDHTSGTLDTDFVAGKWVLSSAPSIKVSTGPCKNIVFSNFKYDGGAENFAVQDNDIKFFQFPQGCVNVKMEFMTFDNYADKICNGSLDADNFSCTHSTFSGAKFRGAFSFWCKDSRFSDLYFWDMNDSALDLTEADRSKLVNCHFFANGTVEAVNDAVNFDWGDDIDMTNCHFHGTGFGVRVSTGDSTRESTYRMNISDCTGYGATDSKALNLASDCFDCKISKNRLNGIINIGGGSRNKLTGNVCSGAITAAGSDQLELNGNTCAYIDIDSSGGTDIAANLYDNIILAAGQDNGIRFRNTSGGTSGVIKIYRNEIYGSPTDGIELQGNGDFASGVWIVDNDISFTTNEVNTGSFDDQIFMKLKSPRVVSPSSADSMEFGDEVAAFPSGTFTYTLKAATDLIEGTRILCKNGGAGVPTIDGNGTDIDGAATLALSAQYDFAELVVANGVWNIAATNF